MHARHCCKCSTSIKAMNPHNNLIIVKYHCCLHLIDEETEAQRIVSSHFTDKTDIREYLSSFPKVRLLGAKQDLNANSLD